MARTNASNRLKLNARTANALNFQNVGTGVVTVPHNTDIDPVVTMKFTWSAWIYQYRQDENVLPRVIQKAPHYMALMGDQTNGRYRNLALEVQNAGAAQVEYWGDDDTNVNQWLNVVTTFDNSTCRSYVNNSAQSVAVIAGPYASLASTSLKSLEIGNSIGGSPRNLSGLISDVMVWNRDVTATEVDNIFNGNPPATGLVLKLPMSEGSGVTVADASGNGYNGLVTNAVWTSIAITRDTVASRSASGARAGV